MINISLKEKNQFLINKKKKLKVINFFFPFYPLKVKNVTNLMVLLAALMAIRFLTQLFSLPIGPTLRLSLNWVPASIIGWLFGPVIGFFTGAVIDTLTFFVQGGVWFWMYAIQEPLITMLAGLISGIYHLRKDKQGYLFDYLFNQIVIIAFTAFGIFSLIKYGDLNFSNSFDPIGAGVLTTQILTITCLSVFFVISEVFLNVFLIRSYKNNKSPKLFLYVSLLSVLLSIIFSLVLGTLSAIEYYRFLHKGSYSKNFIIYGAYYYLIPRVVKETFKLPFMVLIIVGVLKLSEPNILKIRQHYFNKW